jgi:hypothetical protein
VQDRLADQLIANAQVRRQRRDGLAAEHEALGPAFDRETGRPVGLNLSAE